MTLLEKFLKKLPKATISFSAIHIKWKKTYKFRKNYKLYIM